MHRRKGDLQVQGTRGRWTRETTLRGCSRYAVHQDKTEMPNVKMRSRADRTALLGMCEPCGLFLDVVVDRVERVSPAR